MVRVESDFLVCHFLFPMLGYQMEKVSIPKEHCGQHWDVPEKYNVVQVRKYQLLTPHLTMVTLVTMLLCGGIGYQAIYQTTVFPRFNRQSL